MDDPREDSELDHVNSKLDKGLTACRAIVSNYRALIAGRVGSDPPHPPSKNVEEDR
jgi:hypothetical protein